MISKLQASTREDEAAWDRAISLAEAELQEVKAESDKLAKRMRQIRYALEVFKQNKHDGCCWPCEGAQEDTDERSQVGKRYESGF
jgi:hypothetical protein